MFRSKRTPGQGAFLIMDVAKASARAAGKEILDLSVGSSDLAPPPEALAALKAATPAAATSSRLHRGLTALQAAVDDPATHKYCLKSGTMPLLHAATAWYQQRFGIQLDPGTEAICLVGSQEGLAHLLLAVADPGDGILMTDVAYPSYFGAVTVAGLTPYYMPLNEQLLPDLARVPPAAAAASKMLLLNYPNNPTAAVADEAFFADALRYCERHDLLLVHDNPYVDQMYDGTAPSPLALPGGRDRVVELFSFAKSYHLGGFRLGFALGNAAALASLESIKAPIDFNQYLGIQRMGVECLQLPQQRVTEYAAVWRERAHTMVAALRELAGWEVAMPSAGMYLWARLPHGIDDDMAFCTALVAQHGVALAPGRTFGPGGAGHVRVALVLPPQKLREAAASIAQLLSSWPGKQQLLNTNR